MRLLADPVSQTTSSLIQSSVESGFPTDQFVRHLLNGLWAHPWLGVLAAFLVGSGCVRTVRDLVHSGHARDVVRTFSRADKIAILIRAGGRCEHHSWLGRRCNRTVGLEADHVHPHSRGGWTDLANGQALCRPHNKAKAARVPWGWELKRLSRRRAAYFPPGTPTEVVRHRPRWTAPV